MGYNNSNNSNKKGIILNQKELDVVKQMYKTDIHCHLDGCLRPSTMLEIAIKDDLEIEMTMKDKSKKDIKECSIEEIKSAMEVDENTADLIEYLEKFAITTKLMQTKENLERIAYELVEDFKEDNVIYSEIRFGPHLHLEGGLTKEEVVEAVCKGTKRGEEDFKVTSNVILCILRNFKPELGYDIVELANQFKDNGVVGIDIAGDEFNYPVEIYEDVLKMARLFNLNITIHAGESRDAQSVRASIENGADRIGHGINSMEDDYTMEFVELNNVTFEVSFKSNMGTKLMEDFTQFPLKMFLRRGINCSICTDNRLMSNTSISKEVELINQFLGDENPDVNKRVDIEDFMKMFESGVMAAYITTKEKKKMLNTMRTRNNKLYNLINPKRVNGQRQL